MNLLLKPIIYYSIFNHYLTKNDLDQFCNYANQSDLNKDLEWALNQNLLVEKNGYYVFAFQTEYLNKREAKENVAHKMLPAALQSASLIFSSFPFTKGVAISGSLSKNYYDKDSDLDFFIITTKKRLWTCRFIMTIYKKIALLNSYKYFCINYFLSEDHLTIEEQNLFTATEIKTLIACEGDILTRFFEENKWVKEHYQNISFRLKDLKNSKKTKLAIFLEKALNKKLGNLIEGICFKIIFSYWKIKYQHKMSKEDFALAFKSNEKVSKHHPQNFQKQVIEKYNLTVQYLNKNYPLNLSLEHV